jgi:putative endonuclease
MASKPGGTLYTGVTSDLQVRVYKHKHGLFEGFTKKYGVKLLAYFEEHGTAMDAVHREKRIKKWPREWKINLIRGESPDWNDLAAGWYPKMPSQEEIDAWLARIAVIKDEGNWLFSFNPMPSSPASGG